MSILRSAAEEADDQPIVFKNGVASYDLSEAYWLTLSKELGSLICSRMNRKFMVFVGRIVWYEIVHVMRDTDGILLCASSDRIISDVGQPGTLCRSCKYHDRQCRRKWRIAFKDTLTGALFAHTLSTTGTFNFSRYLLELQREETNAYRVYTEIFVEVASRADRRQQYHRLQFARWEGEAGPMPDA